MRFKRFFFERPTLQVAADLLGKFLVREIKGQKVSMLITETEAYIGEKDLASHARFGKTQRNEVMYGKAGVWYIYLIYGLHEMLNVVTEKPGHPAAVLIRAGILGNGRKLKGPGSLTRALKINRKLNAKSVFYGELRIEDRGVQVKPSQIKRSPRIGVDYSGVWKDKKWRFVLTIPNE